MNRGKIGEVLGMGKHRSDGVSRGVVSNIQKTVESIEHAVRQAEDRPGWTSPRRHRERSAAWAAA